MHWYEHAFDDVYFLNIFFMSFKSNYMLYIILLLP